MLIQATVGDHHIRGWELFQQCCPRGLTSIDHTTASPVDVAVVGD